MANTYTQLYIQLIWAVKGRENLIPKIHKDQVEKYMTGVIQERKHKLIEINCQPDHLHIFIGWNPNQSISKLVNEAKTASTKFIKKQSWMPFDFSWQRGFGAFSYSHSQIDGVVKYLKNQEEHHRKIPFREEYLNILQKAEMKYEEQYLFDFYENKGV